MPMLVCVNDSRSPRSNGSLIARRTRSATSLASSAVRVSSEEQRELVTAEARGRVGRSQAGLEPRSYALEKLISGGVSEAVVYGLEVVEIGGIAARSCCAAP